MFIYNINNNIYNSSDTFIITFKKNNKSKIVRNITTILTKDIYNDISSIISNILFVFILFLFIINIFIYLYKFYYYKFKYDFNKDIIDVIYFQLIKKKYYNDLIKEFITFIDLEDSKYKNKIFINILLFNKNTKYLIYSFKVLIPIIILYSFYYTYFYIGIKFNFFIILSKLIIYTFIFIAVSFIYCIIWSDN